MLSIFLRKKSDGTNWKHLKASESLKEKEKFKAPKSDDKQDPSAGNLLLNLCF